MGKRTDQMKQTDAVDTSEPFDTRHETRAGIYDSTLDDVASPTYTAEESVPTSGIIDESANEVTSERPSPDDLPTAPTVEPRRRMDIADGTPPTNSYAADTASPLADIDRVTTNEDADMVATPAAKEPWEETEESPDVQAARARIEQTRTEMSETIDAIKEKLSPQHVLQEARDTARMKAEQMAHTAVETAKDVVNQAKDKAQEVAPKIVQTVKRNPLPFLAGGLIFGWIILRSFSRRRNYCD
jgi:vacuolar-type H+-ATPase subunit H